MLQTMADWLHAHSYSDSTKLMCQDILSALEAPSLHHSITHQRTGFFMFGGGCAPNMRTKNFQDFGGDNSIAIAGLGGVYPKEPQPQKVGVSAAQIMTKNRPMTVRRTHRRLSTAGNHYPTNPTTHQGQPTMKQPP